MEDAILGPPTRRYSQSWVQESHLYLQTIDRLDSPNHVIRRVALR